MSNLIHIATDWWSVSATVFSGIITAVATMGAVIYTNYRTKKQLVEQEVKHKKEQIEQFKIQKYVVIKPILLLNTFTGILDRLIIQNDNDRVLLFSGDDGFEFFDDVDKRAIQICRMLLLENTNINDIQDIIVSTESILLNLNTEEHYTYNTYNATKLLRGKESIIIRVTNQIQYTKILEMNQNRIPSLLDFSCKVEYSTLAHQRITYVYQIKISSDRRIEVIKDGVETLMDIDNPVTITPTIFRNLQDYISGIDRSSYYWEKMGQAQMRGIMANYIPNQMQQGTNDDKRNNICDKEIDTHNQEK